jgi:hypothetical protein
MPQTNPLEHSVPDKILDASYLQLGLQPGATMLEIEAAYWQFARELRGQAAMAPYNEAYEALANRAKPRPTGARSALPAAAEGPQKTITVVPSSPSKFGWPAN